MKRIITCLNLTKTTLCNIFSHVNILGNWLLNLFIKNACFLPLCDIFTYLICLILWAIIPLWVPNFSFYAQAILNLFLNDFSSKIRNSQVLSNFWLPCPHPRALTCFLSQNEKLHVHRSHPSPNPTICGLLESKDPDYI